MKKNIRYQASEIKSICTKFFYEGNQLCFQIIVNSADGLIYYQTFYNYQEYQLKHNQIIAAINKQDTEQDSFLNLDEMEESHAYAAVV